MSTWGGGGGGGAGGMLEGSATVTAQAYGITVGSGGNSQQNGANSTFDSFAASGGGRGGDWNTVGTTGGSGGGGGGNSKAGGTATLGQGNNGGVSSVSGAYDGAAGGGGKGDVGGSASGGTAGNGGAGTISTITGSSVAYAGGGGGGGQNTGGTGGYGIGGNGGCGGSQNGADGATNTGSGGGGAGGSSGLGGKGGSGIVILRYVVSGVPANPAPDPSVSTAESFVSPAFAGIVHTAPDGSAALVSLEGSCGTVNGLAVGDNYFALRYPLSPTGPTSLILHRSGLPDLATNILWREIDLGDYGHPNSMSVCRDESLLLTAGTGQTGMLQIVIRDASDQVWNTCTGVAGEAFPVLFDQPGVYTATATLGGMTLGSMVVNVYYVNYNGPIACQVGYRREKDVEVSGALDQVLLTEVSVKEPTPRGARLYITAQTNSTSMSRAWLNGPPRLITQQAIDGFLLQTQAKKYIQVVSIFPDGSRLLQTNLEMIPKVENLVVRMHIFISGVTFEDSTLDMVINTSDFTYDAASGKWLYPYRMIAAPGVTYGACHTIAIYQGSDQVGQ
jgi:hypothetical protein